MTWARKRPGLKGVKRPRRGVEILEAALVTFFVAMPLTCGMVEFSYYFHVQNLFQGAAREGARAIVIPGATTADANAVITAVVNGPHQLVGSYTTAITAVTVNGKPAHKVEIKSTWGTIGLSPMRFIPASQEIKGSAIMLDE